MGHVIIKPAPERDEYVYWSTIVEAPLGWGDRAEMLRLVEDDRRRYPGLGDPPEVRLDRADRFGSSAKDGTYRWGVEELIYEQRGYLARKDLYRACELLGRDDEPAVWDLMTPFEDEVRRG